MNIAYLIIGGNIGNRAGYLKSAIQHIEAACGNIKAVSSIYETAPWGNTAQGAFLNQVLILETTLEAEVLLNTLLGIEEKMGRIRTVKMGPRTIDIDILFFNQLVMQTAILTLPHPHLHNRKFVLTPLKEIAPALVHPIFNKTIDELFTICTDNGIVKKI